MLDELLDDLRRLGLRVAPGPDGSLRLKGPAGRATPELLARLKEHKEELAERLKPPPVLCYLVGKVVLVRLPQHDGLSKKPFAAEAWRAGDGPWRPMDELPEHWAA